METHIEINDDRDLHTWARIFGVTPQDLVRLVDEVGPSADRVRGALKRRELAKCRGRALAMDLSQANGR